MSQLEKLQTGLRTGVCTIISGILKFSTFAEYCILLPALCSELMFPLEYCTVGQTYQKSRGSDSLPWYIYTYTLV